LTILDDLREFDIEAATLTLWLGKRYGSAGAAPKYTVRWVQISDELSNALKSSVATERDRIEEVQDYSLLAQNNEGSVLSIATNETHVAGLLAAISAETQPKKVSKLAQVQSADFFAIKLVRNDVVLAAVTKTDNSWHVRNERISAFFVDEQLGLDARPSFDIPRVVDFLVLGQGILIRQKGHFESLLNYKQAHKQDFVGLQAEAEFSAVLSDLAPLVAYVGENKIQLRRASAIREKGHYRNPVFMAALRARHLEFGLNIQFDNDGRIVPTPETCADIMRALLDHRLASGFSANVYDVPDAKVVPIGGH
jgi:hypothetical protein